MAGCLARHGALHLLAVAVEDIRNDRLDRYRIIHRLTDLDVVEGGLLEIHADEVAVGVRQRHHSQAGLGFKALEIFRRHRVRPDHHVDCFPLEKQNAIGLVRRVLGDDTFEIGGRTPIVRRRFEHDLHAGFVADEPIGSKTSSIALEPV